MAIISCPECGRQVSDKALKCPQCNYAIGNLEKQESVSLQALQEEIQNIVSASGLTVKVSSMGKTLLIKMQRPKDKPDKPVYSWLWIHITPKLKPEVLIGFNKLLITSNFEGDIQPEWEDQSDINEKGVRIPNKKEKKEAITGYVFLAILIVGFSSCSYFSNRPRPVETTSNTSTSNTSTSSPENLPPHTVASRVSLGSNRERIQVNSLNPQLSKGDCEKLADNYKPQGGQVSVHKPSLKFKKLFPQATEQEIMKPFCVNNLDGTGIFFNDYFFEGK